MFYAHFVLAKKGPLARIWLAAHWEKKLTKAHVFETNIESSVEGILQPKVKMALRTSGHLLLGVVRIYSRKAKYLLADCNDAFIKIKMAFRPNGVDLPEENREAAVATITLPEVFYDFDSAVQEKNTEIKTFIALNRSRVEDITLKEDYGNLNLMTNDGFGDMAFDEHEMARDATNIDEGFDHASFLLIDDKENDKLYSSTHSSRNISSPTESIINNSKLKVTEALPIKGNGLHGTVEDEAGSGLLVSAGLFDDASLGYVPIGFTTVEEEASRHHLASSQEQQQKHPEICEDGGYAGDLYPMPSDLSSPEDTQKITEKVALVQQFTPSELFAEQQLDPEQSAHEQTTLIHNEDETFALAPLDAIHFQGVERTKSKRKRKLIVDEIKNISGEEMKFQLSDTSNIVTTLDLAPPTKRLMDWKETGGVEKLFALPGHSMLSETISRLYQRHLSTQPAENEEFGTEDIMEFDQKTEKSRENSILHLRKRKRGVRLEDKISIIECVQPDVSFIESAEGEPVDNKIPITIDVKIPQETSSFALEELERNLQLFESVPVAEGSLLQLETAASYIDTTLIIQEHQTINSEKVDTDAIIAEPIIPQQEENKNNDKSKGNDQNDSLEQKLLLLENDACTSPPEEQLSGETYEQFEERILNERTAHMLHIIRHSLESCTQIPFSVLARNNKKKQVAQKFYIFLVLKKQQAIELIQDEPYGELYISSGPKFSSMYQ